MTNPDDGRYLEDFDVEDVQSILTPDFKLMAVLYMAIPVELPTEDFGKLLQTIGAHIESQSTFGQPIIDDGYQVASGIIVPAIDGNVVLPYAIQAVDAHGSAAESEPWAAMSMAHKRISEIVGIPVEITDPE